MSATFVPRATADLDDVSPATPSDGQILTWVASTSLWTPRPAPSVPVSSVFGRTGAVVATSGDYAVGQVTGAAPLASPTFTGTPAAPTASGGTNTTQVATTAFVTSAVTPKAADSAVVHLAGTETISGAKTFTSTLSTSGANIHAGGASIIADAVGQFNQPVTNVGHGVTVGSSIMLCPKSGGAAGSAVFQIWYDATPTYAINLGMAVPGGATSAGDMIVATFSGTTWAEAWRSENKANASGSHVSVPISSAGRYGMTVVAASGQAAPLHRMRGTSSTSTARDVAFLDAGFLDATDSTWKGYADLDAADWAGRRKGVRVGSDGTRALLGFLGANPVSRRSGDVAAGLVNLGLFSSADYSGGSLGPGGGPTNYTEFSAENKDTGTLPAGTPAATHSSGVGFVAASAADDTRPCLGVLPDPIDATISGLVATSGTVQLDDWTAVVGSTTLSTRAAYDLGTTPGTLTATPPATGGQVVQRVGVAVAPDTLELQLRSPILL